MSNLKCEKVERELELNGQKAKFVASTLNLDYVIIDKTLYLGLDWYDIVIEDVRAKFDSDEAITERAKRIVAANAAFEFVGAHEYGNFQITVYAKENLGYVALHQYRKLFYVQFMHSENFAQDQVNKIPEILPTKEEICRQCIENYKQYLEDGVPKRIDDHAWKDNRFTQMKQEIDDNDKITVTRCNEDSFWSPCLNCKKDIDYSFDPQSESTTKCPNCGTEFVVSTTIEATANFYIERI